MLNSYRNHCVSIHVLIFCPFGVQLNCLEDREMACAGLANLVLEPDVDPSLMKLEIVRRVGPLILDKEERVQEVAIGILRLVIRGGDGRGEKGDGRGEKGGGRIL